MCIDSFKSIVLRYLKKKINILLATIYTWIILSIRNKPCRLFQIILKFFMSIIVYFSQKYNLVLKCFFFNCAYSTQSNVIKTSKYLGGLPLCST